MNPAFSKLTLIFPPLLEAVVTEAMHDMPGSPGFTLLHAQGHGSGFARASAAEQVRGHVERRVLIAVVANDELDGVLARLGEQVPAPEVVWWVEPVLRQGRLA